MRTKALRIVRRNFTNPLVPISTQRHNMRAWVKSVRYLGNHWILAVDQPAKPLPPPTTQPRINHVANFF